MKYNIQYMIITALTVQCNSSTRIHYRLNMYHSQSVRMPTATELQQASSNQQPAGNVTDYNKHW